MIETLSPTRDRQHLASFTELASRVKALADPTRLAIVTLLARREHCVCDLLTALRLPQSTCSHHLGVLKRAGLIRARQDERDGRWTYYSLDTSATETLHGALAALLEPGSFDPTPAYCE